MQTDEIDLETLRGKSDKPLKMRDGSTMNASTLSFDEGDLAEFVQSRKQKQKGPSLHSVFSFLITLKNK